MVSAAFKVGTGIGDITGPSVEVNFMGYAVPNQRGSGIHLRLYARAFIMDDGSKRIVTVNMDCGMGSDVVKQRVIDELATIFPDGRYSQDNVLLGGTHTHSGPAGFQQYVLYQVTSWGWVEETASAFVKGIVESIVEADGNMVEAKVGTASGMLFDANINRSPTSYLLNPADERAFYAEEGDTDKLMTLLRFTKKDKDTDHSNSMYVNKKEDLIGVMNFFAVHGTSMNNTNTLISGDNKGYAAYKLEREVNGVGTAGQGPFISGFFSTNLGDVSPNTNGAKCIDTGEPCDGTTSTCNGRCENCIAFGPGSNMEESTQIIGEKQARFAQDLIEKATTVEDTTIDFRHSFVKMEGRNVTYTDVDSGDLKWAFLCQPAMGYAFAAGTTDGPGMFGFHQSDTTGNPFWNKVRDWLSAPSQEQIDCQAPKPILLNTGTIDKVQDQHAWDPTTVAIQIMRIGSTFILAAPVEFTTMSGRRLRAAVRPILQGIVGEDQPAVSIVIAGLANGYSSYVATFEEFQAQRYEAASTIFGPHSLAGYIQEFTRVATDMAEGKESETDAPPTQQSMNFWGYSNKYIPSDDIPLESNFGDIVIGYDAHPIYQAADGDEVFIKFHAGNPRNNQQPGPIGSYLVVEKQDGKSGEWVTHATDSDWSTKFEWKLLARGPYTVESQYGGHSIATLRWVPSSTELSDKGTFRMCYYGDYKTKDATEITPFSTCSRNFRVI